MFCRYCGKPIPDDAPFCSYCGKQQFEQHDQPTAQLTREPEPTPTYQPTYQPTQSNQPAQPAYQPTYPQQPSPVANASLRSLPVLRKERYNSSIKKRLVFFIVMLFIILALMQVLMGIGFTLRNYAIGILCLFLCGLSIWSLVMNFLSLKAVNHTELNITQQGLYGSGSNMRYNKVIPFELEYSRIAKVSSLPKHLVITTHESVYYVLIPEPQIVEAYIDDVMREYAGR